MLGACASNSGPVARVDTDAVARYRSAGYAVPTVPGIEAHRIRGPLSEAPWTISLTRPADHAIRPLIVYLPALGQSDDAPNHWVVAWAQAGYAVISIQALEDDANVWATSEARSGDFERIARSRYADELMSDRIARLAVLLNQVKVRSLRAEPGLDGLDWSHLALAGADLGAYTVQSVIASSPQTLAAIGWPLAPVAYIVISPYAVRSHPAPDPTPHAPVLMISSRDDVDAYGVVTDAAVRRLAFDRLGAGKDYFLEIGTATHRWLGGQVQMQGSPEATPRRPSMMADESPERRARHGVNPGQASDAMAPGGDDEELTPEKRAKLTASREELEKARSRALTHAALSEVSFEQVSIAFLDTTLRALPAAEAWLANGASGWLQEGDRLKLREGRNP